MNEIKIMIEVELTKDNGTYHAYPGLIKLAIQKEIDKLKNPGGFV